jgi:glycosyltransferase involved in cell wall biosynthesis
MLLNNKIVIVTPIYEDNKASRMLFQEISQALDDEIYIVAVDDGSVKEPVNIKNIEDAELQGVVIKLKRNLGHQGAISVGLGYVSEHLSDSKYIVVMDSDGEDKPVSIHKLIQRLSSPEIDLVVAKRKSRIESLTFRTFYIIYKWIFQLFTGYKINFGNFMALKPNAVNRLIEMRELWLHVAGCVLISKLRITTCELDRGRRYTGASKMNFVSLALHGFRGLMVFAEDVLVRVGIACSLIAFLSIFGSITAIVLKIVGVATPGWFSIALGILLLVFLQTATLTLMTLMLTGVVKSGAMVPARYVEFIHSVSHSNYK